MKDLLHTAFFYLMTVVNIFSILQLLAAFKWPHVSRVSFFLLFAAASIINFRTAIESPWLYFDYAGLTWSDLYKDFIHGWFGNHLQPSVVAIAICQALISISMLLKGWLFKIGSIGGIIFLLALIPLGTGSAFPSTAIMAIAMLVLLVKHKNEFVWQLIGSRHNTSKPLYV